MPSALWRAKSGVCQVEYNIGGVVCFPGAAVDGGFGVCFHPGHGGVGVGLFAPVAGVDEGYGGWEGFGEGFVRVWEGIRYAGE